MTLGLWTDNGSNDKGSKWSFKEVGVKHNYTLFSDGMPSSAVVTINGKEFRGLNAQGDQTIELESLEAKDVAVKVGGGYLSKVTVDNENYQVDVKFIQFFIPTENAEAEKQYAYLLHMPAAYIKRRAAASATLKTRRSRQVHLYREGARTLLYLRPDGEMLSLLHGND